MGSVIEPILLSLIAGMATEIGGIIVLMMRKVSDRVMSFSMGLASGVMLLVAFNNLFLEAAKLLILSSLLIDEIKLDFSSEHSVMHGQAIKDSGELSKEIDAVIFSGKPYYEWQNIGYAIIPSKQIKAVFEANTWFCSGVSKQDEYKDLCDQLKPFSPKVFLFCFHDDVSEAKINEHKKLLKSFGYTDVFILKRDDALLEKEGYRFVQTIKRF